MSESASAILPATLNRDFTLGEYIDMRDTTWKDLKNPGRLTADRLERLNLLNEVVKTLLKSRAESVERFLAVLQCQACELFILRARREIRAENRQSPFPLTPEFVRGSLELALSKDETIPTPAPSSALPKL